MGRCCIPVTTDTLTRGMCVSRPPARAIAVLTCFQRKNRVFVSALILLRLGRSGDSFEGCLASMRRLSGSGVLDISTRTLSCCCYQMAMSLSISLDRVDISRPPQYERAESFACDTTLGSSRAWSLLPTPPRGCLVGGAIIPVVMSGEALLQARST